MKHEEECFITYPNTEKCVEKTGRKSSIFNALRGVWICNETLFRVFHITSKTNAYFRRKLRRKLG